MYDIKGSSTENLLMIMPNTSYVTIHFLIVTKCPYCGKRDEWECACGDAATGG